MSFSTFFKKRKNEKIEEIFTKKQTKFSILQKYLINLLEVSASHIKQSERYELMGELYKIAIPLYELERNFPVSIIQLS